ncbi:MAG: helix-turn-helix domain-containing protein [Oscillospiraceae bacterium]|nr:helix-turn-helix domain-containing protein [Oscillospiraceae bacterium]
MIYGLSDKIRKLRTQKNLTQSQVAKRLGITKNAVNSWENSASSPTLKNIAELAWILGVSTDYLLGVERRVTLDISDLDELQCEAMLGLKSNFEKMNLKNNENL